MNTAQKHKKALYLACVCVFASLSYLSLRGASLGTAGQDMLTLVLGLLVEALPFVVLGVTLSSLIQTYVSSPMVMRFLSKRLWLRRLQLALLGLFMPVCECGNVPVARSLTVKGVHPADSLVFLLSAPSINLVTIVVTLQAFSFAPSVAVFRVAGTLFAAMVTAAVVTRLTQTQDILTTDFKATCEKRAHSHRGIASFFDLFTDELWRMSRLLVVGALVAAASQIIVPREIITSIGSQPILAVCAMLVLAFVVSLCSSVDAFFALAYINTFSLGSLVTFLVAGPMVDIKMIALMKTTFTTRVIVITSAVVAATSAGLGVILSYAWY